MIFKQQTPINPIFSKLFNTIKIAKAFAKYPAVELEYAPNQDKTKDSNAYFFVKQDVDTKFKIQFSADTNEVSASLHHADGTPTGIVSDANGTWVKSSDGKAIPFPINKLPTLLEQQQTDFVGGK